MRKFIALSGGCDPIHIGHLRYIKAAMLYPGEGVPIPYGSVLFFLNSDAWLQRKKGYIFMPFAERRELLEGYGVVVEKALDDDGTVCESLKSHRDELLAFGKGGDRVSGNTPEEDLCDELGLPMIWGLGGGKIQSSSGLVANARYHPPQLDYPTETQLKHNRSEDRMYARDYTG